VCETYRIPHSHYLGGPLVWTPLDRAKTEAYTAWKNAACPGCHTRREEWDPKRGGHRHAYIAHADRCPGCELKAQEWDNIEAGPGKAHGVRVGLKPNPELLPPDESDDMPERLVS
jgi:hypothetical protein